MEDTDIIELFLNRSEEAIRQTDIKYSKLCFGIAWNILLNKEDSEECVNDTWLITWNEIPPKIPKILSAFLGKITRNQAIDCLRRKNALKDQTLIWQISMVNWKDLKKRYSILWNII